MPAGRRGSPVPRPGAGLAARTEGNAQHYGVGTVLRCVRLRALHEVSGGRAPTAAYQRIVVRLAETRCGFGWRSYDERFRRLAAANPSHQYSRVEGNIFYNRDSSARPDGIEPSAWSNRPLAAARARTPDRGAKAPTSGAYGATTVSEINGLMISEQ